jgi:sirohydrochlorin ferrochelatase
MHDFANTAVLLIAHGSRRASANEDAQHVARKLQATGEYAFVTAGYLELASPTIPEAAGVCVDRGARRVLLLPYFLSAGTHVVDDLRTFCTTLSETYPHVTFELCPPLGLHPLMLQILRERLQERIAP